MRVSLEENSLRQEKQRPLLRKTSKVLMDLDVDVRNVWDMVKEWVSDISLYHICEKMICTAQLCPTYLQSQDLRSQDLRIKKPKKAPAART